MIGVIATLPIQEAKMNEAIDLIKKLMVGVAREEGTMSYTMNRDKAKPNTIVIMERYKDKAALDHHSSTPHFKAFFKEIGACLAGKPEISVMEEIDSIR